MGLLDWPTAAISWLERHEGLWTALAAVGATIAAWAAVNANRASRRLVAEQREARRPWLATTKTETINQPGGYRITLTIKNFGDLPATKAELHAWQCTLPDTIVDVSRKGSAHEIVPEQVFEWPFLCDDGKPADRGFLVFRLRYWDPQGRFFDSWMHFNWPVSSKGLATTLSFVDIGADEKLRGLIQAKV